MAQVLLDYDPATGNITLPANNYGSNSPNGYVSIIVGLNVYQEPELPSLVNKQKANFSVHEMVELKKAGFSASDIMALKEVTS